MRYETLNKSRKKTNSKNKSSFMKTMNSRNIPHKLLMTKQNYNNPKEINNFKKSVSVSFNKNKFHNLKKEVTLKNKFYHQKTSDNLSTLNQKFLTSKSGNINFRTNLIFTNPNEEKKYKTNFYSILSSNLRPLTNDSLRNKSSYQYNMNKKLKKHKTFNKNKIKIYENESGEDESSESYDLNKKDNEFNIRKKLYINGRETTNYERFCYDTMNEKLLKEKEENNKKLQNIKIKYNQKVFSRNNRIIIPCDELKKYLTISSEENNLKILKKILNSLNFSKSYNKHIKKENNTKILGKIINLKDSLNEFKYYVISDLINKKSHIDKKIIDIENKLCPAERRNLQVKNIIYEKLNKNQKECIHDINNKDRHLNELIDNYDKNKSKKLHGFIEKKFIGEIKRMNDLNIKDSIAKGILEQKVNFYTWKQNINKIEEEKIKKNRKNLSKTTKKIRNLAEIIYNTKININKFH